MSPASSAESASNAVRITEAGVAALARAGLKDTAVLRTEKFEPINVPPVPPVTPLETEQILELTTLD